MISDLIENARRLRAEAILRKLSVEQQKGFCPTGQGGGVDPSCGSGSGGGGANTGAGSYESYNTRIEGTQAEADREVTRTSKAVAKAKQAIATAAAKPGIAAAKHQAVVDILKGDLAQIQKKKADLEVKLAESKARLAALKALLKPKKSTTEDDLDEELKTLGSITKGFRDLYDEVDEFLDRIESELGE